MRKLLLAATAVLALAGNAFAIDAPDIDQAIIKMYLYDKDCKPLPPEWRETTAKMLSAMTERERARALMVVLEAIERFGKPAFCQVMEESVKQLRK